MQPALEKISIHHHHHLSETQPLIGSLNSYAQQRQAHWDMHFGLEFGLVCSGNERRLFCDKSERKVGPGDVWFCGMWESHGMKVVAVPCEVIVVLIWPPLLAQMHFPEAPEFCPLAPFNAPPRQRPKTSGKTRKTMINFSRQLREILSANTPGRTIKLRFALQEILLCVFESWPEAFLWRRRAPSAEFTQINRALQMVFERRSFVSTDEAARACGINRHRFRTLFQAWMNISFVDFSLRHRLQQAAGQLRATAEPLKAISRQWGFADESHFHRLFLRHFGVAPGKYRQRGKSGSIALPGQKN